MTSSSPLSFGLLLTQHFTSPVCTTGLSADTNVAYLSQRMLPPPHLSPFSPPYPLPSLLTISSPLFTHFPLSLLLFPSPSPMQVLPSSDQPVQVPVHLQQLPSCPSLLCLHAHAQWPLQFPPHRPPLLQHAQGKQPYSRCALNRNVGRALDRRQHKVAKQPAPF